MLKSFDDVKQYFRDLKTPIYFVSPTSFNLLGLDQWIPSLKYINFIDTYDGKNPNSYIPTQSGTPVFNHLEEINTYLLGHKECFDLIAAQTIKPQIIFLFFNEELEELCRSLDCKILLPDYKLVQHVDSKLVTTRLGNEANVPSVPNVLAKVESFSKLKDLARVHHLGNKWVIQTAYGDSGKTTFFIETEEDYNKVASEIESEEAVKVMKHIRCESIAIEGCATRCGTFVGPMLSELIGEKTLTPYKGGWCGNDWKNDTFSEAVKTETIKRTQHLGDALYKAGYRGYFEVDYLRDLDTGAIYLGELNPRLSGVTALTNSTPACQSQVPLFVLHVLEYSDIAWELDPNIYNAQSISINDSRAFGQLILKYTEKELRIIENAPETGVYRLAQNGELQFVRPSTTPADITSENEAFVFRIMMSQDYAYYGGDLAFLFTQTKVLDSTSITPESLKWVNALRNAYQLRDLTSEEKAIVERYQNPGARLK